ncbi:hypothetical protein [Sphingomonas sp. 1185]|uniref:hypothetical protein n=1 Tax=Sphingomonas sp. 1185 TaxID=3156411 RepID=UPI0033984E4B
MIEDSLYGSIHWTRGDVRVGGFRTASAKGPETTVTVQLVARNGYALADLLRQLHDEKALPAPKARPRG